MRGARRCDDCKVKAVRGDCVVKEPGQVRQNCLYDGRAKMGMVELCMSWCVAAGGELW